MPYKVKIPATIYTDDLKKLGDSVVNLSKWCEDEFNEVASSLQATEPDFIWNSVPPKPRRGTYAYADGTNWNPGYGEGPYTYNGSLWVPARGDLLWSSSQNLSAAQRARAYANLGYPPRNYIINGGMQISQENGTTAGTTTSYYAVDQFPIAFNGTTGTYSAAQVASATPGGSPNRLRVTVTAADAAVASTDNVYILTKLEGARIADLRFGSASAKTITLQFGCKGPAGTYCIGFWNAANTRTYVAEYTIAAGEANTDVIKSVTLTADTTGAWATDNTIGLTIFWTLMAGSSFQAAPNTWSATASAIATSNQFNLMGTNGNVFELFDVELVPGSVAPAFQLPDYASELKLCQRFFQLLNIPIVGGYIGAAGNNLWYTIAYTTEMRAVPTFTLVTAPTTVNSTYSFGLQITQANVRVDVQAVAAAQAYIQNGTWKLLARL